MNTRRTDDEVHELDGIAPSAKDQLDGIFELQCEFMNKLGIPRLAQPEISGEGVGKMLTSYSLTCTTALSCEITELLDALPWKPWKKTYSPIDLKNVQIEIVDMLHFVVELALIWGLDSKTLFSLYMKKMQENIDRQSKGY